MNIHSIFGVVSPIFRKRRFRWFLDTLAPAGDDLILDLGGRPETWTPFEPVGRRIDVLNLPDEHAEWAGTEYPAHNLNMMVGDALALDAEDGSYDIVFSNSVLEHVGTWENQVRFAEEARRVGRRLWVQTPAREFFIEPHYVAPFVHWLPKHVQRRLLRWFTVWGWLNRPTPEEIDASLAEIRLVSRAELRTLFPDCEILVERFLWVFPKSYVAWRGGRAL